MKTYIIDTNVFIRFLTKDHDEMYEEAKRFLEKGKTGDCRIKVLDVVLLEVEYVLRKVYGISREKVYDALRKLVNLEFLDIDNRTIISQSIEAYKSITLDLVDIILYYTAKELSGEVFSFDNGYKKFKKAL